jgi:hypothetical protein
LIGHQSLLSCTIIQADEILDTPNQAASRTLLAFCESGTLKETKVLNDLFLSMIGELSHTMDIIVK